MGLEKLLNNLSLHSKTNEAFLPMQEISLSTIHHSGFKILKKPRKKGEDKASMTAHSHFEDLRSGSLQVCEVFSFLVSKMTMNTTKIFTNKKCSFYYSNVSKVEHNLTKNDVSQSGLSKLNSCERTGLENSQKENELFANNDSLKSFLKQTGSSDFKVDRIVKNMYRKIKNYQKKNNNLERQLRNRNKDYLYALKEIEKIKIEHD